jgi:hypothetical protein
VVGREEPKDYGRNLPVIFFVFSGVKAPSFSL